jgi:glutathione synthase/RimK-type ligase-like ATP-grasp enzyme
MILVASHAADGHLPLIGDRLDAAGADWRLIDTDQYPERIRIADDADGGLLRLPDDGWLHCADVSAVCWRRPRPPVLQGRPGATGRWAEREAFAALDSLLLSIDAKWVNHPRANRIAEDKPGNLRRAAPYGLSVPDWLVTNDPELARAFYAGVEDIVVKPVKGAWVADDQSFWTQRIREAELLDALGPEPYLLQRFIDKTEDVRVVVVGDEVFGVAIDSQSDPRSAVDMRAGDLAALPHRQVSLPESVSAGARALTLGLDLTFAALDFAVDREGRHWFLELNPNGQWAWLELRTGVPIATAIAGALL